MQSTPTLQETDPHDIFVIEPDVVLAARSDSARADQASPDPVHDALSRLAQRATRTDSDVVTGASPPTVDTTFRAAAVDTIKVPRKAPREPSAIGRWAKNTSIAFLFALCSAIAASTWRYHGDTAKQMIANWLPPFVLASWSPTTTPLPPPPAEQPDSPPAQATAADPASAADQASTQPVQPSDGAAPAPATPSAESAPSVQSMARDLATMGQQIEQLKASIEQLKAGQAQMSRDLAKTAEQNLRLRTAALPPRTGIAALSPPRPIAAPIRKPKPAFPPAQAAAASTLPPLPSAAPAAPPPQPALSQPVQQPQATVESDGGPVVRPPMPLH
jgi:hypothetical protein